MNTIMTLEKARTIKGRTCSYETCGTVDGPGLRFVVFTQGCPLRCLYCHNPESWEYSGGTEVSAGEVFDEVAKYKNFMNVSGGGLTLSGGESLTRPQFTEALLMLCKEAKIHTVVDTSGFVALTEGMKRVIELTDLFLLDIKSFDSAMHQIITGESNDRSIAFAEYLAEVKKPMILRYVLVPGLNDRPPYLEALAKWAANLGNVESIELLPFHKMGEFKWEQYGLPYRLSDTPEPSDALVQQTLKIFREHDLIVSEL